MLGSTGRLCSFHHHLSQLHPFPFCPARLPSTLLSAPWFDQCITQQYGEPPVSRDRLCPLYSLLCLLTCFFLSERVFTVRKVENKADHGLNNYIYTYQSTGLLTLKIDLHKYLAAFLSLPAGLHCLQFFG
jgi:hypothetical protein